jgi:hypothetical protein
MSEHVIAATHNQVGIGERFLGLLQGPGMTIVENIKNSIWGAQMKS